MRKTDGGKNMGKNNSYSNEFKAQALKLSDEVGTKKAAAQLGIPYFTLADWRNRVREKIEGTVSGSEPARPLTEQELRIRELEKENAELRNANEILKDALGFSAKDRKK